MYINLVFLLRKKTCKFQTMLFSSPQKVSSSSFLFFSQLRPTLSSGHDLERSDNKSVSFSEKGVKRQKTCKNEKRKEKRASITKNREIFYWLLKEFSHTYSYHTHENLKYACVYNITRYNTKHQK